MQLWPMTTDGKALYLLRVALKLGLIPRTYAMFLAYSRQTRQARMALLSLTESALFMSMMAFLSARTSADNILNAETFSISLTKSGHTSESRSST
ncbi:hypothetical protein F5Y18DRAFT_217629 [Xylariaceae sp. FL1019]|nr:hypothetical protein F5Y18DRAFT_217629 [Xylariaceae sp. FL1019]